MYFLIAPDAGSLKLTLKALRKNLFHSSLCFWCLLAFSDVSCHYLACRLITQTSVSHLHLVFSSLCILVSKFPSPFRVHLVIVCPNFNLRTSANTHSGLQVDMNLQDTLFNIVLKTKVTVYCSKFQSLKVIWEGLFHRTLTHVTLKKYTLSISWHFLNIPIVKHLLGI